MTAAMLFRWSDGTLYVPGWGWVAAVLFAALLRWVTR